MAWIDYRKAFDSVPHSWILKVLDLLKILPFLINFLRVNMSMWELTLNVILENGFFLSFLNTPVKRTKLNRIWL